MGWSRLKNGTLLTAAEQAGFDVLLSSDKTMKYEQNMSGRKIGVVSMSDNHWSLVKPFVADIDRAVHAVKPGEFLPVYCGRFVPAKFRNPSL
jgi:hypothetical protein